MLCAKCNKDNPSDASFCEGCGAKLELFCPACNAPVSPGARFCKKCGTSVGSAKADLSATASSPGSQISVAPDSEASDAVEGERKTVTALFAYIKGSMDLIEDLDPEEARAIVDPALKLMMDAVHRFDGYIVQSTGDGIFALFGAPVAHEDHPQRSLYAALRMQDEVKRYAEKLRAEKGVNLQVRVGANTGEVVVRSIKTGEGHVEYTPIGHSTSLASRLQALAAPGSIAVSETVRKLAEGYFALKPLGPARIKGVSGSVDIFEVTGLGPLRTRLQRAAGRGLTKFVGRGREMEAMHSAAELARAGHGQIVAAMAEAGTGKSRLIFEFKAKNQSGWNVLETFSVSHGKASAYFPVIDLLHNYFKITGDDDQRARRAKITGNVLTLDRALEDTLPYIFALLGASEADNRLEEIDAQIRRRRTLDAIKRLLLRESLSQPLMVIFEDLHWIDEETQAFLNLLADSIGTAKILLLVNYRPEYSHQWNSKTYYTQLRLDPLGKESAEEMLSSLLGDGSGLAPLRRVIIEKTEGNPFFMEETYQVLLDEGALVRDGATLRLTKPLGELKIPPTVQAILAARIDRLPADEKDLLQTLAVIGKEFSFSLVRRVVARSEDELNRILNALQLAEFIYEHPALGDVEYTFKHALSQEVAYNSVLLERRKLLHERIGAAFESTYAQSFDDHLVELGHHYAHSNNAAKAVEFCLLACRQSVERASFKEAVAHFETGMEKLQELPDGDDRAEIELDLRIAVQYALMTIKGYASQESEQTARRTVQLSERPGVNWEKSFAALSALCIALNTRAKRREASEVAAQLVASAEERGGSRLVARALSTRAFANMLMGEFEPAQEDFERAIALLESLPTGGLEAGELFGPLLLRVQLPAVSAWNLCLLGYPDRALERAHRAIAAARQSGSKSALEAAHEFACEVYQLRDEVDRLRISAEVVSELATELGNPFRRLQSQIFLGWTEVIAKDFEAGIPRMRHNLAQSRANGTVARVAYNLAMIGIGLSKSGKPADGLREIEESLALVERTGERVQEAEVHRLKGEMLLAQGFSNTTPAEDSFRTAIEISRKQHAKSWELRSTTSLARLLAKQGKGEEARAMLAEIYNWFTEGFDTANLKDAKTLLEELGTEPNP
jgi:class 3 adenylate cyclase/tetratricopeptide (TPR) repeat protein